MITQAYAFCNIADVPRLARLGEDNHLSFELSEVTEATHNTYAIIFLKI